jgi:hypothetical protein
MKQLPESARLMRRSIHIAGENVSVPFMASVQIFHLK